jgi:hypothetical protein
LEKGDLGGFSKACHGKSPLPPFAKGGKLLFADMLYEFSRSPQRTRLRGVRRRTAEVFEIKLGDLVRVFRACALIQPS